MSAARRAPWVARLAVSIAPGAITVVAVRRSARGARLAGTWDGRLTEGPADGAWPALTAAVDEARAALSIAASDRVSVALQPPLAQTKVLAVPRLPARELQPLVARNARRYFAADGEPLVVDARPARAAADGSARAVAVCARESVVIAVTAALAQCGLTADVVTGAPIAVAAALRALVPAVRRGGSIVALGTDDRRELLLLDDGVPSLVQTLAGMPLPAAVAVVRQAAPAFGDRALDARTALAFGDAASGDALLDAVAGGPGEDRAPLRRVDGGALRALMPAALAALGAALLDGATPLLETAASGDSRRRMGRRQVASLWSAAALVLMLTAGAHLWDLRRELAAVTAEREARAAAVAEAAAARRASEAMRARLAAVARLDTDAPRWATTLTALSAALPEAAGIVSLSASGPAVRLGGVATSAHTVVPALATVPHFRDVSLAAPVRRDGEGAGEHFEITFTLRPTDDARKAAAPATVRIP